MPAGAGNQSAGAGAKEVARRPTVGAMTFTTADIPDLAGRTAVVTGANGGLGLATAKALAGAGATVVMAARDQAKAASARAEILALHPDATLEVVELDLASLASVAAAAGEVTAAHDRIDLLVNNARLMALPPRTTAPGSQTPRRPNPPGPRA